MKTMLLLILPFLLSAQIASGRIQYRHSIPFWFPLNSTDSIAIKSYDERSLPINQVIRIQYQDQGHYIDSVRFDPAFKLLFDRCHDQMERAEKAVSRRQFKQAVTLLDSVRVDYPQFPYLYVVYFLISQKSCTTDFVNRYLDDYQRYEPYFTVNEKAQTWYIVYEYYRDCGNDTEQTRQKRLEALKKSYHFRPNADKLRILNKLQAD